MPTEKSGSFEPLFRVFLLIFQGGCRQLQGLGQLVVPDIHPLAPQVQQMVYQAEGLPGNARVTGLLREIGSLQLPAGSQRVLAYLIGLFG